MNLVISEEDPQGDDARELLSTHLAFSRGVTPIGYSYALDVEHLAEETVVFFGARADGLLVGIGALKRLDATHAELKSMHTRESRRGEGVGRAMVDHLLAFARRSGYRRVSLETGTMTEFAPARTLYECAGFRPCPPFGDYAATPYNTFFTINLS